MPAWAYSLAATALIALTGWVVRVLVIDRIKRLEGQLEKSSASQGKRIGDVEAWQKAHDAVERDRRRRKETRSNGPSDGTE